VNTHERLEEKSLGNSFGGIAFTPRAGGKKTKGDGFA
jgi:hypothetical protein